MEFGAEVDEYFARVAYLSDYRLDLAHRDGGVWNYLEID